MTHNDRLRVHWIRSGGVHLSNRLGIHWIRSGGVHLSNRLGIGISRISRILSLIITVPLE